jgi:hypothetical protein
LTFDFANYLMEHKEEVKKLPESFELEFMEKDFPKLELNRLHLHSVKKQVRVKNSFDVTL